MTTQLVLRFDNADDLERVIQFLRENGLEKLAFLPKKQPNKIPLAPLRRAGFSKASFVMDSDFNAPLDDFKEYM
jgi:hypothetical protein